VSPAQGAGDPGETDPDGGLGSLRVPGAARGSRIEQVRAGLLSQLVGGALPLGSKLPNEQTLADHFQVSRATVREAVGALVAGGYLARRHGSGTYVTALPHRHHALDATLSYTQMIREAGMVPGLQLLSVRTRTATSDECVALKADAGVLVRVLQRLRTADERPVIYSVDRVPAALLAGTPDRGLQVSMFEVLAGVGARVHTGSAVLTPVVADPRMARILGVGRGTALQQIEEIDYTEAGHPVMFSSEWHVPGIFELRVNRRS
jgi:GntR family transcriptional regulator